MNKTQITIKYSQTTRNKLICQLCRGYVKGEHGFIWLGRKTYYDESKNPICLDCWNKILNDIETKKKTRKKDYHSLLKKQMLRKLK